jgi:molybdate transport system regulatory protein
MEIVAKLYLVDEKGDKFMGLGVLWLLQSIEKEGSLRAAALEMDLSYSKAFKMVKKLEEQLNRPVIERRKGGSEKVGSTLNEFGRRFIRLYDKFQTEAKLLLDAPFEDFLREFEQMKS